MSRSNNILYKLGKDSGRLRLALFFLFAGCILAASVAFFILSVGKPYIGAVLSLNDHTWTVQSVDPNGLARQAGINEGDSPTEINGQPAAVFLEKYEKAGVVFEILIKELTVINDDGQLKSVARENSSPSARSVAEVIAWFITCLMFWVIGFYVFLKRPKNAAALLLCLGGLFFGLALSGNMAAERLVPAAFELEVAAAAIGPWLLLHFFLILPEERAWLRNIPLVYLVYLPAAVTIVLFFLIGYADGQPLPGFRTFRLLGYGAGFLLAAGTVAFNYFRARSPRTRQQMKIVLVSCLAALVPFLVLSILPATIQNVVPSGFNLLFIVFIPLGMGYAVVTQKLMDIDVVIRRSVIYGLITVVMAAVLSVAIFLTTAFQESLGVTGEVIIALALGGIAVVLFGPIKRGIESLVDKLFYKDRYDYRQIIQSLSTSLNLLKDLTDISRLIVGTVVQTLNLAGGCLFFKGQSGSFQVGAAQGIFADTDKQKQLVTLISQQSSGIEFPNSASNVCPDLAFLIPLMVEEKRVGILCLSQKISRQDFSSDDVYLLQGLASVSATSLRSAMLLRDVSMRDTFISVVSHELRTPLTSIMGYAELLLRREPPDITRKRWLKNIFDNSQRVNAMVDDLLNVSRIQSGKVGIKLERVKLPDVLKETLSLAKESTNRHEFVVDIEPHLPNVFADRDKLSHVVGNILSNAVKYSPNGGCITLSVHNDHEQRRIVVSVADEGIGIGPADRDLLFTTFHRIQRPETRGIRGSGLGLYIAKEWMEAMGGKIWLESELNKGSTFFIAIPTQNSSGTG
jgi:nitrogen-specific signal transduction histidine kinase